MSDHEQWTELRDAVPPATLERPETALGLLGPPGQMPVVAAALAIGIVLLSIQLWLLTASLDLYLAGMGSSLWISVLVSGAVFLGGLLVLWLLHRRPSLPRVVSLPSELTQRSD